MALTPLDAGTLIRALAVLDKQQGLWLTSTTDKQGYVAAKAASASSALYDYLTSAAYHGDDPAAEGALGRRERELSEARFHVSA